jgi:hypothetical protein
MRGNVKRKYFSLELKCAEDWFSAFSPLPHAVPPLPRPLSHANGCLTFQKLLLTGAAGGKVYGGINYALSVVMSARSALSVTLSMSEPSDKADQCPEALRNGEAPHPGSDCFYPPTRYTQAKLRGRSKVLYMQRIAIAGATGYIGGRLAPRLLDSGYALRCMPLRRGAPAEVLIERRPRAASSQRRCGSAACHEHGVQRPCRRGRVRLQLCSGQL